MINLVHFNNNITRKPCLKGLDAGYAIVEANGTFIAEGNWPMT